MKLVNPLHDGRQLKSVKIYSERVPLYLTEAIPPIIFYTPHLHRLHRPERPTSRELRTIRTDWAIKTLDRFFLIFVPTLPIMKACRTMDLSQQTHAKGNT